MIVKKIFHPRNYHMALRRSGGILSKSGRCSFLSDFKSNEYFNLLGGNHFEPHEENPMIGWRGASRYYSDEYKAAFGLECKAIKMVREEMGLDNVVVMIPFCRTVDELIRVKETMKEFGLERGKNNLQLYLMAEVPSNVILADEFAIHIEVFQ